MYINNYSGYEVSSAYAETVCLSEYDFDWPHIRK